MNPLTILVPLLSASIVHPVSFSLSLSFSLLEFFTRPLLLPLRQVYHVLVLLIRMLLRLEVNMEPSPIPYAMRRHLSHIRKYSSIGCPLMHLETPCRFPQHDRSRIFPYII
ncbi:hypothetical protein CPC735_023450 [Coccidioides posadasii C735 delta SOWgp]|uniref:Uncharacterized protein n=1 Tax=Coccidioides posadasii (strain C735) TaxID=222929 RepID=C5P6F9_COCP7|nr:hypothetical protein CPC735_023450 [Coccidioides posadasii C735 delta SOWgp]EER27009.1 hypothetical protein CPC735_023450 [Coccidioides posadasii C735 delta SOWgp]|eukprot:XP_003069154.1 hypothetical protein CPC735_023450 [Coccidioides posadasii C735 delta SOWgp]